MTTLPMKTHFALLLACLAACLAVRAASPGDKIEILSGASPAINWQTQQLKVWTLSANSTPTFTNTPTSLTQASSLQILVIQPAGQNYTITTNLAQWQGTSWNALPSNTTNTIVFQWLGSGTVFGWWIEQPAPASSSGGGNVFGTGTPATANFPRYNGTTGTNLVPSLIGDGGTGTNLYVPGDAFANTVQASNSVSVIGAAAGQLTLLDTGINSATLAAPTTVSTSYRLSLPTSLVQGLLLLSVLGTNGSLTSISDGATVNTLLHSPGAYSPVVEADFGFTDNQTADSSTNSHGLLPRLSGSVTDVLRGDGTYGAASGATFDLDATIGTSDATPLGITTNAIAVDTTIYAEAMVSGGGSVTNNRAAYKISAGFTRDSGSAYKFGTNYISTFEQNAALDSYFDLLGNNIVLYVKGAAGDSMGWRARGFLVTSANSPPVASYAHIAQSGLLHATQSGLIHEVNH